MKDYFRIKMTVEQIKPIDGIYSMKTGLTNEFDK